MAWTSQLKAKLGEQWVPHVRNNAVQVSYEITLHGLVKTSSEPLKLGLEVVVGSSSVCLGLESRANYEEGASGAILGFGCNSTFEVGSSSRGNKEHGPHGKIDGLEAVGFDPQEPGYQAKVGSTEISQDTRSLELLGTANPAMEHKSTASPPVDWASVDAIFRVSRWGLSDVPIKVSFFTVLLFSCL